MPATRGVASRDVVDARSSTPITSTTEPSGGSNELENLVELCWFHHRLVHEGGWKLRLDSAGNVVVTNPAGNVIPSLVGLRGAAGDVAQRNRAAGIAIGPTTVSPRWYGDPLDLGHITTALWCADQRHRDRN